MGNPNYDEFFENVIESLRKGICKVEFIKANGDLRVMYCTRSKQIIGKLDPSLTSDASSLGNKYEEDKRNAVVTVFDIEKNQFRRINLSTLEKFEYVTDNYKWKPSN